MSQRHPIQNDVTMLVTTVVENRKPLFRDPAFAREAIDTLFRVRQLHPFFLYGFVIMPDHVHLLLYISAPATVSGIINIYKSGVTFNLGVSKIWQPRFHIRIAKNPIGALHYIHENPVKAGLVQSSKDYLWSSASGLWDCCPL